MSGSNVVNIVEVFVHNKNQESFPSDVSHLHFALDHCSYLLSLSLSDDNS